MSDSQHKWWFFYVLFWFRFKFFAGSYMVSCLFDFFYECDGLDLRESVCLAMATSLTASVYIFWLPYWHTHQRIHLYIYLYTYIMMKYSMDGLPQTVLTNVGMYFICCVSNAAFFMQYFLNVFYLWEFFFTNYYSCCFVCGILLGPMAIVDLV